MKKTLLTALIAMMALRIFGQQTKPNIVFIYTDDQRFDGLGVIQKEQGKSARFPYIQTPGMDRLAKEGVRFRNAFVTLSLCSPSRAAILTGKYNHINKVIDNYHPFTDSVNTYPAILKRAGYQTAYIGKWHMGSQRDKRPGFDYSASFIGQGQYNNCPFEINGVSQPTKGWVDDISTDYAIDYITQNKDKPFCLILGFKSPHGGWTPPKRYKDLYQDVILTKPVNELSKPSYISFWDPKFADPNKPLYSWTDSVGNKRVKPYWATVTGADDNVGRILDALKKLNLEENTIVVFTSDNGYFHGEHSLQDKRAAYEESMRVPLIIKYPAKFPKGKIMDDMVLNIDLPSTLLDLAGLTPPDNMQGKSMVNLVSGKAPHWRDAFFFEYYYESNSPTPTMLAVRTKTAKLIKYPHQDDWNELFDLTTDPYEMHNLYNDPQYATLKKQMEIEFQKQLKEVKYADPDNAAKLPLNAEGKYKPYVRLQGQAGEH